MYIHLLQILRGATDHAVGESLVLRRKSGKIAADLKEIKGSDLKLRGSPTVKRRFVSKHLIFHIGHRRAAEDQKQLGICVVFIDEQLQR